MLVDSIFSALGAGLKLWSSAESRKYIDRYLKLRQEYYEEINKPEAYQNHAKLDNIQFELSLLCHGFSTSVGQPNPKDTP